jgi:WD40 repeat protein
MERRKVWLLAACAAPAFIVAAGCARGNLSPQAVSDGGPGTVLPTGPTSDAAAADVPGAVPDGGIGPGDAGAPSTDAASDRQAAADVRPAVPDGGIGPGDAGAPSTDAASDRQVVPVCATETQQATDAGSPSPPTSTQPRTPTLVPFGCNPLPRRFALPSPTPDVPGRYARCASLGAGGTIGVALSPDGRIAALINGDGIARLVDVASQQVTAVLAPLRSHVDQVAFSPAGDTVLTIANGEREATLWRAGPGTPIWTSQFPGHRYAHGGTGAIAFAPDGRAIAASPGTDLYWLDAATGALRASHPSIALMDVAYALGGTRIVAADAILTGHCYHGPNGGSVVVLDADSLGPIATIKSWAGYSSDNVTPTFRASPTADVVLVPASSHDADRSVKAFRISDGVALPATGMATLPIAFMPEGNLLVSADGQLRILRFADGSVIGRAPAQITDKSTFAVSRDGSAVAIGAPGPDLLHVWNTGTSYLTGVCAFDGSPVPGSPILSGDGRLAAYAVGPNVMLVRPDDGAAVTSVTGMVGTGEQIGGMVFSRTGSYLAADLQTFDESMQGYRSAELVALRTDWGRIVGLVTTGPQSQVVQPGSWGGFAFSPDERSFFATWQTQGAAVETLARVDLAGALAAPVSFFGATRAEIRTLAAFTRLDGFSRGCPDVLIPLTGLSRSCDACDETPIARDAASVVVSPDGGFALTGDPWPAYTATLWSLPPDPRPLRVFGPRVDATVGSVVEEALAVTAGGARLLLGARPSNGACYSGPGLTVQMIDGQTGAILDELPPDPRALDDEVTRLVYGSGEVWCAR